MRSRASSTDVSPTRLHKHRVIVAAGGVSDRAAYSLYDAVHPISVCPEECDMQKRLVTSYAMPSAEAADENQRRVEAVFAELAQTRPDTVSYIVLRLEDD